MIPALLNMPPPFRFDVPKMGFAAYHGKAVCVDAAGRLLTRATETDEWTLALDLTATLPEMVPPTNAGVTKLATANTGYDAADFAVDWPLTQAAVDTYGLAGTRGWDRYSRVTINGKSGIALGPCPDVWVLGLEGLHTFSCTAGARSTIPAGTAYTARWGLGGSFSETTVSPVSCGCYVWDGSLYVIWTTGRRGFTNLYNEGILDGVPFAPSMILRISEADGVFTLEDKAVISLGGLQPDLTSMSLVFDRRAGLVFATGELAQGRTSQLVGLAIQLSDMSVAWRLTGEPIDRATETRAVVSAGCATLVTPGAPEVHITAAVKTGTKTRLTLRSWAIAPSQLTVLLRPRTGYAFGAPVEISMAAPSVMDVDVDGEAFEAIILNSQEIVQRTEPDVEGTLWVQGRVVGCNVPTDGIKVNGTAYGVASSVVCGGCATTGAVIANPLQIAAGPVTDLRRAILDVAHDGRASGPDSCDFDYEDNSVSMWLEVNGQVIEEIKARAGEVTTFKSTLGDKQAFAYDCTVMAAVRKVEASELLEVELGNALDVQVPVRYRVFYDTEWRLEAQLNSGWGTTVDLGASAEAPRVEEIFYRSVYAPEASLTVTITKVSDGQRSGTAGVVRFALSSPAPVGGIIIGYSLGGTATMGEDYPSRGGTIFVAEGLTQIDLDFPIISPIAYQIETIVVTVNSGTGYDVGTPSSATISIALVWGDVGEAVYHLDEAINGDTYAYYYMYYTRDPIGGITTDGAVNVHYGVTESPESSPTADFLYRGTDFMPTRSTSECAGVPVSSNGYNGIQVFNNPGHNEWVSFSVAGAVPPGDLFRICGNVILSIGAGANSYTLRHWETDTVLASGTLTKIGGWCHITIQVQLPESFSYPAPTSDGSINVWINDVQTVALTGLDYNSYPAPQPLLFHGGWPTYSPATVFMRNLCLFKPTYAMTRVQHIADGWIDIENASAKTVTPSASASVTVTLSNPAPAGGLTILVFVSRPTTMFDAEFALPPYDDRFMVSLYTVSGLGDYDFMSGGYFLTFAAGETTKTLTFTNAYDGSWGERFGTIVIRITSPTTLYGRYYAWARNNVTTLQYAWTGD